MTGVQTCALLIGAEERPRVAGWSLRGFTVGLDQLLVRERLGDVPQCRQYGIVFIGVVLDEVEFSRVLMNEGHPRSTGDFTEVVGHREVILRYVIETGTQCEERIAQSRRNIELQDRPPLLEDPTLPLGTEANRCADVPVGREIAIVLPLSHVRRERENRDRKSVV